MNYYIMKYKESEDQVTLLEDVTGLVTFEEFSSIDAFIRAMACAWNVPADERHNELCRDADGDVYGESIWFSHDGYCYEITDFSMWSLMCSMK